MKPVIQNMIIGKAALCLDEWYPFYYVKVHNSRYKTPHMTPMETRVLRHYVLVYIIIAHGERKIIKLNLLFFVAFQYKQVTNGIINFIH